MNDDGRISIVSQEQSDSLMHSVLLLIRKNLANIVSILGVLPLCLLFQQDGYQYLIPLMIYANVMDDLDGVAAARLNTKSDFGARLDNVCDAIGHSILMMVVGLHYGGPCAIASLIGTAAIIIRSVTRLDSRHAGETGSATNELIRHVFFVLLLSRAFEFDAAPYLIAASLLHAGSMLAPYKLPYLIRDLAKSPISIGLVNVSLLTAWIIPVTTPIIAACFIGSYLYSLAAMLVRMRNADSIENSSAIQSSK